jgi:hypothetical protein
MPALYRERPQPHAPVCPGPLSSARRRDLDFWRPVSGTGRFRQFTWRQARYGREAGGKSRQAWGRGSLRGAAKRRARSEVFRRTARGKVIFVRRTRSESERGREADGRSNARGKNRNRRRRRDIAASRGGATQNAAKSVMTDRIAARGAGPRSVLSATFTAREGKGGGRRGCGEEALQQKRIKRERDDRDAPCSRPLPEPPHRQSLHLLRSQSQFSKKTLVGVRGFEPPAPSSRTRCATRLRYTPPRRRTSSAAAICLGVIIAAPWRAGKSSDPQGMFVMLVEAAYVRDILPR